MLSRIAGALAMGLGIVQSHQKFDKDDSMLKPAGLCLELQLIHQLVQ